MTDSDIEKELADVRQERANLSKRAERNAFWRGLLLGLLFLAAWILLV